MSDLLSPIYVVFDANEGDAFWGLVGVMKMMVRRCFPSLRMKKTNFSTGEQLFARPKWDEKTTLHPPTTHLHPRPIAIHPPRTHRLAQPLLHLSLDPHRIQTRIPIRRHHPSLGSPLDRVLFREICIVCGDGRAGES